MGAVDRILNGESVRNILMEDLDYTIVVSEEKEILEMSKISVDYAEESITGKIPGFIYFSQEQDSHGPRVKFYGGAKAIRTSRKSPSFEFGVDGPIRVNLQPWMNKDNCPNAFDKTCLEEVSVFIQNHLALLLLTWFNHVGEDHVLKYFEGSLAFNKLLDKIEVEGEQKAQIMQCKTEKELYDCCKNLDLYKF